MTITLIPTTITKVGETTQISLGRSREIRGKVRVRARMCTSLLTCMVRIKTLTEALSIIIRDLSKRNRDPSCNT